MMGPEEGEQVCQYLRDREEELHVQGVQITGQAQPYPHDLTMKPQPEPEWVPFVIMFDLGRKKIKLGFDNLLWQRDATDLATITELLENHRWIDEVARLADGECSILTDQGWVSSPC
jgi:hypothetical protein